MVNLAGNYPVTGCYHKLCNTLSYIQVHWRLQLLGNDQTKVLMVGHSIHLIRELMFK